MRQDDRLRAVLLEQQEHVAARVSKLEARLEALTRARRSESDDDRKLPGVAVISAISLSNVISSFPIKLLCQSCQQV